MSFSRALRPLALTIAVAGAMIAPLSIRHSAQAAGTAYVRVFHASPDAPAVAIFVDGAKAVKSLAFLQATAFLMLPAGPHHLQVFPAGAAYSARGGVIDATVSFKANVYYTVAAVGTLKSIAAAVFTTPGRTNAARATISFVHLSPTAPAVDIEAKGAGIVFKDVSFPHHAAAPLRVPSGAYTLLVHPAGTDSATVLTVSGVRFRAGHNYTVAAVGLLKGHGAQKLSAVVLSDDPLTAGM